MPTMPLPLRPWLLQSPSPRPQSLLHSSSVTAGLTILRQPLHCLPSPFLIISHYPPRACHSVTAHSQQHLFHSSSILGDERRLRQRLRLRPELDHPRQNRNPKRMTMSTKHHVHLRHLPHRPHRPPPTAPSLHSCPHLLFPPPRNCLTLWQRQPRPFAHGSCGQCTWRCSCWTIPDPQRVAAPWLESPMVVPEQIPNWTSRPH
ncbi:hypothetical protein BCR44DRAFT_1439003 [Catenaria anguillulae PL171]|uniref:Uncharacterized protein n=1 Tax=Catenaria anguillulae PL171 TaxID=765915 RepID=A0A1Y2HES5_9FUNG|nr:hypothetical protein BCR44DRAFT_1439003 [Catenaria anguillulae PL171]